MILVSAILAPAMAAADTVLLFVPTKTPFIKGTIGLSAASKQNSSCKEEQ